MVNNTSKKTVVTIIVSIGAFAVSGYGVAAQAATIAKPSNNLGLVGYWSLDEGNGTVATDFSGNGNTGTLSGSPAWVTGKRGKALSFNGSNYVSAGTGVSAPAAVTMCAWARADSFTSGLEDVVVARGNSALTQSQYSLTSGYNASATEKNVTFLWSNDVGSYETYETSDTIVIGTWYHLCGVRTSGGVGSIYINGTSRSVTPSGDVSVTTGSSNTVIGRAGDHTGNYYWEGSIDEVRIYNRELSAGEIAALHEVGAVKLGASSADLQRGSSLENGLVGHWTFDGSDVTTSVADRSGQGNNGYFYGGATSSAKTIGKLGQALSFDGTNERVLFTSTGLSTVNAASLWVDFQDSNDGVLLGGTLGDYFFYVDQTDVYYSAGLGNFVTVAHGGLTAGEWNHLTVSRNGTSVTFYKNGVQIGSAQTLSSNNALTISAIGAYDDASFPAQTKLDDVRIYNRALSASEAKQLHNLGQATIVQ